MHFSAGQDVTLKNDGVRTLFQLTIFKHGLLEGSTILLQYSFDQVQTSQNRFEALFFLDGQSHALQILPTLQRSSSIRTLSKALKRPRNNAGLAINRLMCVRVCVHACVRVCVCVCVCVCTNAYSS